jgi:amino acid adenylation domain-containing protein
MRSLISEFQAHVHAHPNSLACADSNESLSYRDLDERSTKLALSLQAMGCGRGIIVGLMFPRSVSFVVGALGIMKAGSAYLPLDPDYPPSRLAFMTGDSGVPVVLSEDWAAPGKSGMDARIVSLRVCISNGMSSLAGPGWQDRTEPRDACYVIYTSGTTGRPKGVIVEHRNLTNLVRARGGFPAIGRADRVLQFSSVSFDASVFEIWLTLSAGAALQIPDRDDCIGPRLLDTIERLGVSVAVLPPALLSALQPRRIASFRCLLSAGDVLTRKTALRWSQVVEVWNGYGPTEATVCSATARFDPAEDGNTVPLGRPIDGAEIYILDASGNNVPAGEVGEICIGGRGVSRGYVGVGPAGENRLAPSPFTTAGGERIYRTGDLGAWRADGQLDFRGRADRQVKIRGFRVELDEVEALLGSLHGVREVAVLVRDPQGLGTSKELAAFVVPSNSGCDASGIRSSARRVLPDFMLPAHIAFIDRIPVTPAGKHDLKSLAELVPGAAPRARAAEECPLPSAGLDRPTSVVLGHWRAVLHRQDIGPGDNFFELGGESLKATMLLCAYLDEGYELTHSQLLMNPTVLGQAALLQARREVSASETAQPPGAHLPLSPQQLQIWMLEKLFPARNAYISQALVHVRSMMDAEVLQRALSQLIERHDVLRLAVMEADGVPYQSIDPAPGAVLEVVSVPGSDPSSRQAAVANFLRRHRDTRFDIGRAPLARWHLLQYEDGTCSLLQTEHHLIHDGWSTVLLLQDLASVYSELSDGRSVMARKFGFYAAYSLRADHERAQRLQSVERVVQMLAGAPELSTLRECGEPSRTGAGEGEIYYTQVSGDLAADLLGEAKRCAVTRFAIFLAAFALAFREITGQTDFVYGCGVANRRRSADWETAGMFVNVVPVRITMGEDSSPPEVLAECFRMLAFAQENSDAPLMDIVKRVGGPRSLRINPVYQIILSSQDADPGELKFGPGNPGTLEEILGDGAKADLTVISFAGSGAGSARREGIRYAWQFDRGVISADVVRYLADRAGKYQKAFVQG